MAKLAGMREALRTELAGIGVAVDVETSLGPPPAQQPVGLTFIVYEHEVVPLPKLERQVIMAKLQECCKIANRHGLPAAIRGDTVKP